MLVGVEGFRPLDLGWDGDSRSPSSPFIRHLALDLVGAQGRDPGGATAAVTTAATAILKSCPDGTVRTLTRAVRVWFVTQGQ